VKLPLEKIFRGIKLRKILRFALFWDDTVSLDSGFPTFQDKTVVSSTRSKCPSIPSEAGSNPSTKDTASTLMQKLKDSRKILTAGNLTLRLLT
jgi:hypothetical protein